MTQRLNMADIALGTARSEVAQLTQVSWTWWALVHVLISHTPPPLSLSLSLSLVTRGAVIACLLTRRASHMGMCSDTHKGLSHLMVHAHAHP
jgi:hypothetical protein